MSAPPADPCRFLILFEGRTGSTLMGQMLNQHPQVIHIGEEVSHLQEQGFEAQRAWMERLYFETDQFDDPRIKPNPRAVGFKVKLRKIASPDQLAQYIEAHGLRVIHMIRQNKIKQVVSSVRAIDLHQRTGSYNLDQKDELCLPTAYEIPIERFNTTLLWLMEAEHRLDCFISHLSVPVLKITYESILEDYQQAMERLFQFLGVEPVPVTPQARKITPDDLRATLSNFEALKTFYRHTPYGAMFD